MSDFILKQISSIEKVYLDSDGDFTEISSCRVLKGERFSYQLAFRCNERLRGSLEVVSELADCVRLRFVGNVPSEMPCFPDSTAYCERTEPGLFPDVLYPIDNGNLIIKSHNWYSVWVSVEIPADFSVGFYPITVIFKNGTDTLAQATMNMEIADAVIPEQTLIYTQWFHSDCIADYYGVEVFSQEYWKLTESFIRTAVHTGVNMLLTPIFTPPLDTDIGGERRTVQLVDVYVNDGRYSFGFGKLKKWIRLARECGIKYFEISHLFTQWGAYAAPKIIAETDGEKRRIFGWETKSDSEEYVAFLREFLPELTDTLRREGVADKTYFHISDEPSGEQIESYSRARATVSDLLADFKIIDAASDYEYYENGIIDNPIPNTDRVEEFIEKGFKDRWTYYCCGQGGALSNRFFGQPLACTEILGTQLYLNKIDGFLQWGFNFYNSAHSLRCINPFETTDADGAFPSGDSFSVYPGKDGAIESVRSEMFYRGLEDMRMMQLAESLVGREKVVSEIENRFGKITFKEYPRSVDDMLCLRDIILEIIVQNSTENI
ncbi:MAG: DUF4091 domain-containing protein [Clostridia bacterium]|nr:DUF4091 domain-containing protein [Clostridia bacterium]